MAWAAAVAGRARRRHRTGADISEIARDGLSARLAGVAIAMARPRSRSSSSATPASRTPGPAR